MLMKFGMSMIDRVIITIPSLKAKPFFGCNKKDKKTEGKSIDKQELFCALKQTFFFLRQFEEI